MTSDVVSGRPDADGPSPSDAAPSDARGGRSVWWARLCGVLAGLAGLAISDVVAGLVAPAGSPVPAVGSAVIELLPAGLVNWGKETLGTADKPVLLVTIAIAVLLLCSLAGQLEWTRRHLGAVVFVALAAIGLVAVGTSAQASTTALLPTLIGLLLGYLILNGLVGQLHRWRPRRAAEQPADSPARRRFLLMTAGVGVGAAVGLLVGRLLARAATAVEDARARFTPPPPAKPVAVPPGADLGIAGLAPYVTPNDEFYRIDTALQLPVIDPENWSLTITGLVERQVTITYAALLARPLVEHMVTLTCVSNEIGGRLISNARWLGAPIRDLLAEAGPRPGADMVLSTSQDGWTAGTPLLALTDPAREAMLAVAMNGEPLPIEHGYPVRMVVPGLYGYVSATKWVTELKVTTFEADEGYWTPLGWSALGPIKLCSRIDVPRKEAVGAGKVVLAGVAWAQHTGVASVEVGIDDQWRTAELADTVGPDTWRQWTYVWDASPGRHTIAVRAIDTNGARQLSEVAPPAPDGATGWHTVTIKVV